MKIKKYILPLIFVLLLTFTLVGNCAWLTGYDQRIKLTIDSSKIDSALSDFPVTVFFTSTQAEEIFTEFDADSDYMKCAFTLSDGTTQLYAEKELFDVGYTSQYPPAQSDTYVKSTTKYSTSFWAYFTTDPTKSVTGSWGSNVWISDSSTNTNQRFHIDLGSAKIIKRIYYENAHSSGDYTDAGVKNFTFWGSNTGTGTFDDLVYGNDEGWTQLATSQATFDQHTASDIADPKYITVTNSTAYRYYAFKFADNYGRVYMGVRRIELQTQDPKAIYHVKVTSVSSSTDTDIYYYYDNNASDNTTYIGAINTTAGGHVWDSSYKAVYHMVDATTSTVLDSTSNSNDGTKKATNEPVEAEGKVGRAQDFDGDDYINIGQDTELNLLTNFTIEYIAKVASGNFGTFVDRGDQGTRQYQLYNDINDETYANVGGTGLAGGDVTADNTWRHSVLRVTSDTQYLYNNGNLSNSGNIGSATIAVDTLLGARRDSGNTGTAFLLTGQMDEVRISATSRNAAWIKATYNSLWDSLVSYGSEETGGVTDNAIMFGMNF